jgi:hypothetical protein
MVSNPGPEGIRSPTRTSPWFWIVTEVEEPLLPIGSGYGTPETELIIWQIDPLVASGIPLAVTIGCSTATITPLSGGPAAPGDSRTEQPMLTGGPGITQR